MMHLDRRRSSYLYLVRQASLDDVGDGVGCCRYMAWHGDEIDRTKMTTSARGSSVGVPRSEAEGSAVHKSDDDDDR